MSETKKKRKTIYKSDDVLFQQAIDRYDNLSEEYELRMAFQGEPGHYYEFIKAITGLDKERTVILRDALNEIINNNFKPANNPGNLKHVQKSKSRFADIEVV
jgi:hypothetical protein